MERIEYNDGTSVPATAKNLIPWLVSAERKRIGGRRGAVILAILQDKVPTGRKGEFHRIAADTLVTAWNTNHLKESHADTIAAALKAKGVTLPRGW